MVKLLEGKPVRDQILKSVKSDMKQLKAANILPTLAIIRIGDDAPAQSYEQSAYRTMNSVGIAVKRYSFSQELSQQLLIDKIQQLNTDSSIHGVMVMQPLPLTIDCQLIAQKIHPLKDVDGLHPINLGKLMIKESDALYPSTAKAVMELLDYYDQSLRGIDVCVVGSSLVVGRPLMQLLLNQGATVTNCHIDTRDLMLHTRRADIVISATGQLGLLTAAHIKPGAVVIDVGYGVKDGRTMGDVERVSAERVAGFMTPVPGGVGRVTTAVLAQQVVKAARLLIGK